MLAVYSLQLNDHTPTPQRVFTVAEWLGSLTPDQKDVDSISSRVWWWGLSKLILNHLHAAPWYL